MTAFEGFRVRHRWLPALIVALTAGVAAPVAAQPTEPGTPEFRDLSDRLRGGDTVTVMGPSIGRVRGRFVDLSSDTLTIVTESGRRTLEVSDIDRVSRRRRGVLLGSLIGLGVGIGLAIPVNMLYRNEGANGTGAVAYIVGLSTATGLGIDALIDLPRTVYRRPGSPRVRLAPQVGPGAAGAAVHVTF